MTTQDEMPTLVNPDGSLNELGKAWLQAELDVELDAASGNEDKYTYTDTPEHAADTAIRLADIGAQIRNLVSQRRQALWDIGALLCEAKACVQHGQWLLFLRSAGISKDKAAKAMAFHRRVQRPAADVELPLTVQYALVNQPAEIQQLATELQVPNTAALELVASAYHADDPAELHSMIANRGVYLGEDLIPFAQLKPALVDAVRRERTSMVLASKYTRYSAKGRVRQDGSATIIELAHDAKLGNLAGREVSIDIRVKNEENSDVH
jgi:hypothetical protein